MSAVCGSAQFPPTGVMYVDFEAHSEVIPLDDLAQLYGRLTLAMREGALPHHLKHNFGVLHSLK